MKILRHSSHKILSHLVCFGLFFSANSQSITNPVLYGSPSPPVGNQVINLQDGYKIVPEDNLYRIVNPKGKAITSEAFTQVGWADHSYTLVNGHIGYKNNDLWGLLHLKSKKTTFPNYTSIVPHGENTIIASKREQNTVRRTYGLITPSEKVIISFKYNLLEPAGEQLIAAKYVDNQNKYGLINKKDDVIIPFIYSKMIWLSGNQLAVVNDQNRTALFSNTGVQLTPFEFDSIVNLNDKWHLIDKKGKKGILSWEGKVVISPKYKKITKNSKGSLKGLPFPSWDLLNAENKLAKNLAYDTVVSVNKSLLKAAIGPYEYLIDLKENPVTEFVKRKFGTFHNGRSTFEEGGKYGAIGNYNELIIPAIYDSIIQYADFFVTRKQVSQNHQWSVFDADGNKINKISYDQIGPLSDGYFSVKKNGVWGFINEYGHEVIKARFDSVHCFSHGLAKVFHKNKYAVIDKFGRYVVPMDFEQIEIINQNIFVVKSYFNFAIYARDRGEIYQSYYPLYAENGFIVEKTNSGKLGLFNPEGQRILTTTHDYLKIGFAGKLHIIGKDGKIGLLNRQGGILLGLEDELEEVGLESEGFIGVRINKKYGFIDFNAKLRVANRYDSIAAFSESMAPIYLLGKWGYINKLERLKIQPKYHRAGNFKNETAIVGRGNQYGIIDKSGQELVKIGYDKIIRNQFDNYLTFSGKKIGLVKKDGYEVIYPKYESINDLGDGNIIIGNHGKFGLVNEQGISTIPMMYDKLVFDREIGLYFGLKKPKWENINIGG